MKILDRNSNNINIATFWENCQLEKYNFDPSYQRPSDVWSDSKKSFLIDTILKNFPMPPIFLHQHIDVETGKTIYDIIDGKQRLSTIRSFINNEISLPDDFSSDSYGDELLNGLSFADLDNAELSDWKKTFWKYELTIEYVDTDQVDIVNNIFDRLNRNGEPLTSQELRNAKFHDSAFYKLISKVAKNDFLKPVFDRLERNRLEDHEFAAELLFVVIEKQVFSSKKKQDVDSVFEQYANDEQLDIDEHFETFSKVIEVMKTFKLDINKYSIFGVSHQYAIFCLAWLLYSRNTTIDNIDSKLDTFFTHLRNKDDNNYAKAYKASMSADTKSKVQRVRRINSILGYLGQPLEE